MYKKSKDILSKIRIYTFEAEQDGLRQKKNVPTMSSFQGRKYLQRVERNKVSQLGGSVNVIDFGANLNTHQIDL